MVHRLEKYHLFCNTPFFELICIAVCPIYMYTTKYILNWNKKCLQNMSEIFDMVHMSQVGNIAEVSRDFRDIISRAKQWRET